MISTTTLLPRMSLFAQLNYCFEIQIRNSFNATLFIHQNLWPLPGSCQSENLHWLWSPVGFCSPLLVLVAGSWSAACSGLNVQPELQNKVGGWISQFSTVTGMVKLTSSKLRIKKAASFLPACQTSQTTNISVDIELRAHLCPTQRNCSPPIYALKFQPLT